MRRALVLLSVLASLLTGCHGKSIELTNGQRLTVSAWKNRWVVLTYWAGWCEQCRKEIPALNAYVSKQSSQVLVLGVNFDGLQGPPLRRLVRKMGIHFSVINGESPFQVPRPDVLPVTYLLDKHTHRVVKRWLGPQFLTWLKKANTKPH